MPCYHETKTGSEASPLGFCWRGHFMSKDFCLARVPLSQSFDKREQAFHGGDFCLCLFGFSRALAKRKPRDSLLCHLCSWVPSCQLCLRLLYIYNAQHVKLHLVGGKERKASNPSCSELEILFFSFYTLFIPLSPSGDVSGY